MTNLILSFFGALVIVVFAIPTIRMVSKMKGLYDIPDERKLHKIGITRLGGLGIFAGFIISFNLFGIWEGVPRLQYLETGLIILFFTGLKDDLIKLPPYKKLIAQLLASSIVIIGEDIRISSFNGLLGIYEIPYVVSFLLTLFTFIVITNSFNLIDGIDGLASGIGMISSITFGLWFNYIGMTNWAVIAFCMSGALLGFLFYNFNPAKIFMGDSGALTIGFMSCVFAIKFIEFNHVEGNPYPLHCSPSIAISILIVPLLDTLRVFIIRMMSKQSPFKADLNHIHHAILGLGLNHAEASLLLYLVNIIFIIVAFILKDTFLTTHFLIISGIAFVLSLIPGFLNQHKTNEDTYAKERNLELQKAERGDI